MPPDPSSPKCLLCGRVQTGGGLGLGLWLGPMPHPRTPIAPVELETDRYGGDFQAGVPVADAAACRDACAAARPTCRAFTYTSGESMCYLKSVVTPPTPCTYCTSGVCGKLHIGVMVVLGLCVVRWAEPPLSPNDDCIVVFATASPDLERPCVSQCHRRVTLPRKMNGAVNQTAPPHPIIHLGAPIHQWPR